MIVTPLERFLCAAQDCYTAEKSLDQGKINAARMAMGIVAWNLAHAIELALRRDESRNRAVKVVE